MLLATFLLSLAALSALASAHSQMTQPQSTSPRTCRLGGEPAFGVDTCRGPCDLRPIRARHRYANFWSPAHPAASYSRGQNVLIKYSRNNHGPGGFIRLSLVKPSQMMHHNVHTRNAFHYSCWGAHPVRASPNELRKQRFGFSMVGSDGEQHRYGKGYYTTTVTIPTSVPDGDYVLGWAWFGGTGGDLKSGTSPQYPYSVGYFGDYYSCSFVRIRGGVYTPKYSPRFINDMSQYSNAGCMSSTDRPGPCAREPCRIKAFFRRPAPFVHGRSPRALTAADFGAAPPSHHPPPRQAPRTNWAASIAACQCLASRRKCSDWHARASGGACRARSDNGAQSTQCKMLCCRMCYKHRSKQHICWHGNVRPVCAFRR
ncbi:unnamed protein product [Agarophyton chilense]